MDGSDDAPAIARQAPQRVHDVAGLEGIKPCMGKGPGQASTENLVRGACKGVCGREARLERQPSLVLQHAATKQMLEHRLGSSAAALSSRGG